MRIFLIVIAIVALAAIVVLGIGHWKYLHLFPVASKEIVQLTPEKRVLLQRLRAEIKFQPNNYPPFGYTGAETPADQLRASAAVNTVIDTVLAKPDGPVHAEFVAALISQGMGAVDLLATEDRERTRGYMVEIWYILGFKDATGLFAFGAGFRIPDGYGEPLPPGWSAPDKPRPTQSSEGGRGSQVDRSGAQVTVLQRRRNLKRRRILLAVEI